VPEGIVRIYMARQFPGFLGVFALGIALRRWLLLQRGRLHAHVVRPVQRHGVLWLLVFLAPSLVFLRFTARSSDFHHWIWFSSYDLVIAVLLLPPLAHAARHVSDRPRRGLSLLQWLGQRSYSLYLWHFPVILTVFGRGALIRPPETDHRALRIVLAAVLTVVVASLSYSLVEVPGIQKGRALAKRFRTGQKAVTADEPIGVAPLPLDEVLTADAPSVVPGAHT
jgi:peptidoglycan/LPS O-acetylase OafA/YrhL